MLIYFDDYIARCEAFLSSVRIRLDLNDFNAFYAMDDAISDTISGPSSGCEMRMLQGAEHDWDRYDKPFPPNPYNNSITG